MWVRENEVGEIAIHYRGQRLHFRESSRFDREKQRKGALPMRGHF